MKFDDASWHYEGDYPADLPESAAATHIGMFLAWALLHGMAGELIDDSAEALAALQRRVTGAQFLITELDEKLIDEDLNAGAPPSPWRTTWATITTAATSTTTSPPSR